MARTSPAITRSFRARSPSRLGAVRSRNTAQWSSGSPSRCIWVIRAVTSWRSFSAATDCWRSLVLDRLNRLLLLAFWMICRSSAAVTCRMSILIFTPFSAPRWLSRAGSSVVAG